MAYCKLFNAKSLLYKKQFCLKQFILQDIYVANGTDPPVFLLKLFLHHFLKIEFFSTWYSIKRIKFYIIIIIIIIILHIWEFFTPAFADGFPLEFQWQQVSSSLLVFWGISIMPVV